VPLSRFGVRRALAQLGLRPGGERWHDLISFPEFSAYILIFVLAQPGSSPMARMDPARVSVKRSTAPSCGADAHSWSRT
jgi:hypothetical protein